MAQKWTPLTTNESQWPAPQSTQLEFPLTDWPSESQPQKPEDISYIPTTSYTPPGSASRTNLAVQQQGRSYEPFILRKPAGIALVTMLVLLGAGVMILGFIVNDKVGGLGEQRLKYLLLWVVSHDRNAQIMHRPSDHVSFLIIAQE